MDIIDDNQYEPDEQFYLKLSLMNNKGRYYTVSNGTGNHENSNLDLTTEGEEESVHLGTRSIMEITILNDDRKHLCFLHKSYFQVPPIYF